MKWVIIGASPYGPLPFFLRDLKNAKKVPDTLALVDLNPQFLSLALPLFQRVLGEAGHRVEVVGTRNLQAALPGADAVFFAASAGDAKRRERDLASLRTVLPESSASEVMAGVMGGLRAGAVLKSLCAALREACPEAMLYLLLRDAATLVQQAVSYEKMHCLGMEAPKTPELTPQGQQQALARLAKVSLEGIHTPSGEAAWQSALQAGETRLMEAALCYRFGPEARVPALCFANGDAFPLLPKDAVLELDAKVGRGKVSPLRDAGEAELLEAVEASYALRTALARAAAFGDRSALREAIEIHPALYGSDRLLTLDLLLALIDSQPEVLPQFGDDDVDSK